MTTVYFVRHSRSDVSVWCDRTRPLTKQGLLDSEKVTSALKDMGITRIISSPYLRAVQTVEGLSKALGLEIITEEDFRERSAGGWHGDNFLDFVKAQWSDFNYKYGDGESLGEVRRRVITALERVIKAYPDETVCIAVHGTMLAVLINNYFPDFGYECFMRIIDFMTYIVKMDFEPNGICTDFKEIGSYSAN